MKNKNILLLGSGISVAPLCDYLNERDYQITVASRNQIAAEEIVNQQSNRSFVVLNIECSKSENDTLDQLIQKSSVVVSFLPGPYQPLVTKYCLKYGV